MDQPWIFVTFNYRVGLAGYAASSTPDSGITANSCLLDQQEALRWVQRNIKAFGGNPNNVTLGGQVSWLHSNAHNTNTN